MASSQPMKALAIALGLLVALHAAASAALLPAEPVYREVRDFVVACDNLRSCVARWAPEDDGAGFDAYLEISRDGGPDGRLRLSVSEMEGGRPDGRSLRLDGKPIGRDLAWRFDQETAATVTEGEGALALSRRLSEGDRLTYATGRETRTVSLRGLKAALLAIDEAQGRLGTAGAFVRVGAAANATVPPPPSLPVLIARRPDPALTAPPGFAARVRRAQVKVLERNDCDDERKEADGAWPLNRDEVLVALGCMMHAYQSSMLLLRAPRDAPEKARLVAMPLAAGDLPAAAEDQGRFVEGEWDPETATFFETAKGRGLGDCRSSTSWVFDGVAFRLAEASRLHRCSGGPPGEWLSVYRSRVVVR